MTVEPNHATPESRYYKITMHASLYRYWRVSFEKPDLPVQVTGAELIPRLTSHSDNCHEILRSRAIRGSFQHCPSSRLYNDYDDPFTFTCINNQVLSQIDSVHNSHHEDRKWNFACSDLPQAVGLKDCAWTDYVNNFDGYLDFDCPNDKIIAGISSYHDNHKEDRRFKFECCKAEGKEVRHCSTTGYLNNFDLDLHYTTTANKVLTGMISEHDSHKEDRKFNFRECELVAEGPELG